MDWITMIFLAFLVFSAVALGIWPLRRFLIRRAILDRPNARSSHTMPTPKGAGLILIPLVLLSWVLAMTCNLADFPMEQVLPVSVAAIVLLLVSWIDDLRSLHIGIRLATHILAACAALASLPDGAAIFQGLLPPAVDQAAAIFLLVWFINLFNFMDGVDGISGVETILICGGIICISVLVPTLNDLAVFSILLLGGTCGFLLWNWHPARIFLGDSGSAPLGFLLGWLLLSLAAQGEWAAALILPAYYLLDSGVTLLKRMLRKEKFWEAHRQHYYQQAVQRGMSHSKVVVAILCSGVVLCVLAAMTVGHNKYLILFFALLTVFTISRYFAGRPFFSRA